MVSAPTCCSFRWFQSTTVRTKKEAVNRFVSRHRLTSSSSKLAFVFHVQGWQYAWESAFSGYEMTPLICVPCREYEQHITGDIAFAARQYWAVTRNKHWLEQEGGISLIVNTARFWMDRAEYNDAEDRYDINGEITLKSVCYPKS